MSDNLPPTKRHLTRQLRERKQRKLYSEEWALGEEEADGGGRGFSLADKLDSGRFEQPGGVRELPGADLTVAYLQRNGFNTPLLFKEKTGLGLRVPTANFSIKDVRMCVGSHRLLDVMDVNTQKNTEMSMKDWQRYYEDPHKERLLNVISLEFSHTKLDNYVTAPRLVRQLDWVDTVWPRHLKDQQIESTNLIEDMMYPKVQKYCLMSVKGCFTDFHIDFGGTSVWYHILKGAKVFWLIPPTEVNLQLYEKWVLSGKQSDVFFGDTVEKCIRVHLQAGNTFFIPTGWIHAVYTPSDSLVFGGNFLHQFGIEKQLKIAQVEDTTKVPQKFRYPFFTEMLWYVLERYVHVLLGRTHLTFEENGEALKPKDEPEDGASKTDPKTPTEAKDKKHIHLTQQELHGLKTSPPWSPGLSRLLSSQLRTTSSPRSTSRSPQPGPSHRAIVLYLHQLPGNRKNVPELLGDPISLIRDVRSVVEQHRHDDMDKAITGMPVLKAPEEVFLDEKKRSPSGCSRGGKAGRPVRPALGPPDRPDKGSKIPRRRRTRCKKCEACQRSDCGECVFCHDMVKFGGMGRAKQTCNMRQCLQPMLPITAACGICSLDGWHQTPVAPQAKGNSGRTGLSALMECAVCYSIVHPSCVPPGGQINEDLPNSWECPNCTNLGLNHDYKPRHFRARQKSSDIRRLSTNSDVTPRSSVGSKRDSGGEIKTEPGLLNGSDGKWEEEGPKAEGGILAPPKKRREEEEAAGGTTEAPGPPAPPAPAPPSPTADAPRKLAFRAQLAHLLCSNSTKALRRAASAVRPAAAAPVEEAGAPPWLRSAAVLAVFAHLSPGELANCALVCRAWARWSVEPRLWRSMSLVQVRVSAAQLAGVARRQPRALGLEWCQVARRQLEWLVGRLPALRSLSLAGSQADAALALRTAACPPLLMLDLSFTRSLDDARVRSLLSPGAASGVSGSGTKDAQRPLRHLRVLRLAGTNIGDVAMRYVVQWLPLLTELDASTCPNLTDAGAAQLASAEALERVSLAGCRKITEVALDHLAKCPQLVRLDLRHVPQVSTQAVIKFAAKSKHNLQVKDVKLVDRRKT